MKTASNLEYQLLKEFDQATASVEKEVRDAMHYVVFSRKDHASLNAAWALAEKLNIEESVASPVIAAFELARCAIAFTASKFSPQPRGRHNSAIEPELSQTAAYALFPLAFRMTLDALEKGSVPQERRGRVLAMLSEISGPSTWLSAVYRQTQVLRHNRAHNLAVSELKQLQWDLHTPVFRAIGATLMTLSSKTKTEGEGALSDWFQKLGLYAHWVHEYNQTTEPTPLSLLSILNKPEAVDVLKSLEAELMQSAPAVEAACGAHLELVAEVLDPLAHRLKVQWQ